MSSELKEKLINETIQAVHYRKLSIEDLEDYLDNLYLKVDSSYEEYEYIICQATARVETDSDISASDWEIEVMFNKLQWANSKINRPRSYDELDHIEQYHLRKWGLPKDVELSLLKSIVRERPIPEQDDSKLVDLDRYVIRRENIDSIEFRSKLGKKMKNEYPELFQRIWTIFKDWELSEHLHPLGYCEDYDFHVGSIVHLLKTASTITVDEMIEEIHKTIHFWNSACHINRAECYPIATKILDVFKTQ